MMAPHWLDEVFELPIEAKKQLVAHDRFKEAIEKAQKAFDASAEELRRNPQNRGAVPAQQARVAFLDAMNAS